MQCECPGCEACEQVCDGTCGIDIDDVCACDCSNEGRINTEYGYLCADCYDFYDKSGFFDE